VRVLRTVEFAANVDAICAVNFLDKNHGDASVVDRIHRFAGFEHTVFKACDIGDRAVIADVDKCAFLDVDDNQGRAAFDEATFPMSALRQVGLVAS